MTADQLLRGPSAALSGPRSESPRSLSNEALMASLRPPADHGSSHALRRSMEPHLIEGLSWFLERAPWQRALLSTGLGALVGAGIVVTLARLFVPELGAAAASATPAASSLPALTAPAAAALLAPAHVPAASPPAVAAQPSDSAQPSVAAQPSDTAQPSAAAQPSVAAPALTVASPEAAAEAKPAPRKAARKGKAGKRSKKAKQRTRKASSLPARWSELYARER